MSKTASAVTRKSLIANTTQPVESTLSRKASVVTQQSLRDQSQAPLPNKANTLKERSIKETTTATITPLPTSKNTNSVARKTLRKSPHISLSPTQSLKVNSSITKKPRDSSLVHVSPAPLAQKATQLTQKSFRNKAALSEKKAVNSVHTGPVKQTTDTDIRDTDSMALARSLHISGKTFFSEKSVGKRELVSRSRSIKPGANGDIH